MRTRSNWLTVLGIYNLIGAIPWVWLALSGICRIRLSFLVELNPFVLVVLPILLSVISGASILRLKARKVVIALNPIVLVGFLVIILFVGWHSLGWLSFILGPAVLFSVGVALANIVVLTRPSFRKQFDSATEQPLRPQETSKNYKAPHVIAVVLAGGLMVGAMLWQQMLLGPPCPWMNRRINENQLKFGIDPSSRLQDIRKTKEVFVHWEQGMPRRRFNYYELLWQTPRKLEGSYLTYNPATQQIEGTAYTWGWEGIPTGMLHYYKIADAKIENGRLIVKFPQGATFFYQPEHGGSLGNFHEGIVIHLPNMPPRLQEVNVTKTAR